MGIIDTIKEKKEKERERRIRREKVHKKEYMRITNNLYLYKNESNQMLVSRACKDLPKKRQAIITGLLDEYGENKWWLKKDNALELAVCQLYLGEQNQIIEDNVLAAALTVVLKDDIYAPDLKGNWKQYWKDVQVKLGTEKVKEICYTEKDWDKELEEILSS